MTDLPLLSASQIQQFTECQRKWGFKYVAGLRPPPHPSAALGTETHDYQLNPYLMEERPFDFTKVSGEIACALVPLLPKPKTPGVIVKRRFVIPSPRGTFAYQGELDLFAADSACVPGLVDVGGGGVPLIGDFKTTSNLKYAKDEEALKTDIQAQLYAMAIMFEENVDVADLVWFYVRTRPKPHKTDRKHLRVFAPHVAEQFQRIDEIGSRVVAIKAANPKVDELPPNARMCDAFGGCPFRANCNLAPPVFAGAVNEAAIEMNTNDFLANLRKSAGAPPSAAPAPVVPAPAPAMSPPVAAPVVMPTPAPQVQYQQMPGQPLQATPVAAPAYQPPLADTQVPAPTAPPAWSTAPVDPRRPPAINPPESTLPPAPPVNVAPAAPAPADAPKPRGRPRKNAAEAPAAAAASSSAPVDAGIGLGDLENLSALMKHHGVKRLAFDGDSIVEIEVA